MIVPENTTYCYPGMCGTDSKVINFFGGPGCGKSTIAASVFAALKHDGYEAELVPEYAKKCVWARTEATLDDQLYVFAKQHHMIQALDGQVEYIIVDSPMLLSCIYGDTSDLFKKYVLATFNQFNNVNFFITRTKPWHPKGRLQTREEAQDIDIKILKMLNDYQIDYTPIMDVDDVFEAL